MGCENQILDNSDISDFRNLIYWNFGSWHSVLRPKVCHDTELLGGELGPYRTSVTKETKRRATNNKKEEKSQKEEKNEKEKETRGDKRTWHEVNPHAPEFLSTSLE